MGERESDNRGSGSGTGSGSGGSSTNVVLNNVYTCITAYITCIYILLPVQQQE